MKNIPETACSLLWTHIALDMEGDVMPCCRFHVDSTERQDPRRVPNMGGWRKPGIPNIDNGLHQAFTGTEFSEMREKMLAGKKLDGCTKCWDIEESGSMSPRNFWNKRFKHLIGEEPKLKFLEIGFSTHCNLACRMCSPAYSSKWHNIAFPGTSVPVGFKDYIKKLGTADLSGVETIKFVGGEPMMDKNHDAFILSLEEFGIDLSRLQLNYHTNATIRASAKVLEVWKRVKKVVLCLSIDGVGEVNEYQRPGHKWADLDANVDWYASLGMKNIVMECHTVVTRFNIFHLKELTEWQATKQFRDTTFDPTNFPVYLSIRQFNAEKKQRAVELLDEVFGDADISNHMRKKLQQEPVDDEDDEYMMETMKPLDDYFNQDTRSKL